MLIFRMGIERYGNQLRTAKCDFFYECDQALKSTGELQLPHVWIGIEMGFLEMRIAIRADYD